MGANDFQYPENHPGNEMLKIEILVNGKSLREFKGSAESGVSESAVSPEENRTKTTFEAFHSTSTSSILGSTNHRNTDVALIAKSRSKRLLAHQLPKIKCAQFFTKYDSKITGYGQNSNVIKIEIVEAVRRMREMNWSGNKAEDLVMELKSVYDDLTTRSKHSGFEKIYRSVLCYFKRKEYDGIEHKSQFSKYISLKDKVDLVIKQAKKSSLSFDFLAIAMAVSFGIEIRTPEYKMLCHLYRMAKDSRFEQSDGSVSTFSKNEILTYIDSINEYS
jgi:hypothetical protein